MQMHEPPSTKGQRRKQFPWVLWTVVSIIIIAIIVFTVAAVLTLQRQSIAQGIITLTIISSIVTVVVGLFSLMMSFLQWHHPRPSAASESSRAAHTPSQLAAAIGPATEPSAFSQSSPPPTQMPPPGSIEVTQTPDAANRPAGEQVNKGTNITFSKVDWGEAPNAEQLYGREQELSELEPWVVDDRCRVVAVLGTGGIGKTALAARLVERVKDKFAYVFWRELKNAPPLKGILNNCVQFLSDQQQIDLPEDVDGQIAVLIKYLREHRCLLVLDNMETILQAGNHAGQYRESYEGYGRLIQRVGEGKHQSCLLLTSREKPKEIARLEGEASPVRSRRIEGLQPGDGREILRDKGLRGSEEIRNVLVDRYTGNPLALKLVSQFIREVFDGDIAEFLKAGQMIFSDIREVLDQQFERLSEFEQEIMYWLAIEREAVSLNELQENNIRPVSKEVLQEALRSLRRRFLVERSATGVTLQNVIMEYMTDRLVDRVCEEITSEKLALFTSHTLIKAQAKDYVRKSQERLILTPVALRLLSSLEKEGSQKKLKSILATLREAHPQQPGYAAGNVLNLLVRLGCNLGGYDFSHLVVRQAYLQGIPLPDINFMYANLTTSVFTDTFGGILSLAFSSNSKLLAGGTTIGEIRLWRVPNGTPFRTCQGHSGRVRSTAFSPDGSLIASGSDDQTVRLWDVSTGQCLNTLQEHAHWVRSVTFSSDGSLIASGSDDQTVRLWDVSTGQCLNTLQGHNGGVQSTAFSPDGRIIASGSDDQTVRLWDVSTGECLKTLQGYSSWVGSVAFSPPDGRIIASASEDQTIRLWDVSTGQCLKTLKGHANWVGSVAFSPDGRTIVSSSDDRTIRLWDVSTGECFKTLQGYKSWVGSVAFSPDGRTIVSGSEDKNVRLWDVSTEQCLNTLQGHANWVGSVAFSPDGRIIASGSDDRTIRLWDASTGQCLNILQGHNGWVGSVAFSSDGRLIASGGADKTVRLWDVSTGQCLNILQGHTTLVMSVSFSPNEKVLASGSEDQTVRLWDVSTGQCLNILQGHSGGVQSIAFSPPDGRIIVSNSNDGTIKLWDVQMGECVKTMRSDRPYERMNITGVIGLTEAQKATLRALGAVEEEG